MSDADNIIPDEVSFSTFVVSLGTSALVHLGLAEDPELGGEVAVNFPLAKYNIDLLAMLSEKTKGNLTDKEAHLLKSLLYDLRLAYVRMSNKGG